jgi:hypothetical protein
MSSKTNVPDGVLADRVISDYIGRFLAENKAAQVYAEGLEAMGIGFRPMVDHITVRTQDVDSRAREFLDLGFQWDRPLGVLEFDNWWAKVYRRPGFPAIFIDQAFQGKRGEASLIPGWVKRFGDKTLHHCAVTVGDIEKCMRYLKAHGIDCVGEIVGSRGGPLRQIFTAPEIRDGQPYSVLELAERHAGYMGFMPPQADSLMKSSAVRKAS